MIFWVALVAAEKCDGFWKIRDPEWAHFDEKNQEKEPDKGYPNAWQNTPQDRNWSHVLKKEQKKMDRPVRTNQT